MWIKYLVGFLIGLIMGCKHIKKIISNLKGE